MHHLHKQKIFTRASWVLVVILSVLIIYYYSDNRRPDVYHYIDNAEILLSGSNPYIDGSARWGTFGPLIFIPLSLTSEINQVSQIIILTSILSIILFLKIVLEVHKDYLPIITNVTLLLSPIRELFALGQVNAVCFGLLSIAVWLSKVKIIRRDLAFARNLLICMFSACAIDIKPHIVLIPAVIIFLKFLSRNLFIGTIFTLVCAHTIVDTFHQRVLELDWFNTLYNQSGEFVSTESKNLLGIVASSGEKWGTPTIIVSILLFLITLSFLYTKRNYWSFEKLLLLSALSSFFLPYFHFYDLLIPVLVFVSGHLLRGNQLELRFWILLFLLTIPLELIRGFSIAIIITIIMLVFFVSSRINGENRINVIQLSVSFLCYSSFVLVAKDLVRSAYMYQSLLNTILFIGLCFAVKKWNYT